MRKLFQIALTLMLAMSMCVPAGSLAFAEEPDGTLTSQAQIESVSTDEDTTELGSSETVAAEASESSDSEVDNAASTDDSQESDVASIEEESSSSDESADDAVAVAGAALMKTSASDSSPAYIYVNGFSGNDDNAGTKDSPVKTFAKAKELMQETGGNTIYVTGALRVSGTTEEWDLDGKTLKRDVDYHGDLVKVLSNASLTLRNIILDGAKDEDAYGQANGGYGQGGSLVYAEKSLLTLALGAVLQNNSIKAEGHWYPEAGGAVFANNSSVSIEGAQILGNSATYGGGVHATNKSIVNLESGLIANNAAVYSSNSALSYEYSGSGGGFCLFDGAKMTMSGGTIENNSAYNRGGGISLGTHYAANAMIEFTMTGGTINGNTAGSAGGGIFVQAGYSALSGTASYAVARILGGDITNNSMIDTGNGNSMFGGGGIYVNGYSANYPQFHNGELYVTNVNVSGNHANYYGAGYASCPVSITEVNLPDGAVFFGNTTNTESAREVYILASTYLGIHSGDPHYEVSPSMLGGGAYRWVYNDGSEVALSDLQGILKGNQSLSLSNDLTADDEGVQKALSMALVNITGNDSATRGGGIGSNGSVFIGRSSEPIEITVTKQWEDADGADALRPARVIAELYRDGEYVGFQSIYNNDGVQSTTFKNLPKSDSDGHEYVYTVKERAVDGYVHAIEGNAADGFTITNTLVTSVSGLKSWDDQDDHDGLRPESIVVALLRDGVQIATQVVSASDDWSFSFNNLAKYNAEGNAYEYAIAEDSVPAGYEVSIEGNSADGFTITNKHVPEFVSIAVNKVWVGGAGASAIIRLLADGVDTGKSLVLNEANGWSGIFADLPKIIAGKEVDYYVSEDQLEGYTVQIAGDAMDGFTVTNTRIPEEPEEPGTPPDTPPTSDEPKEPGEVPPASRNDSVIPQTGDDHFGIETIAMGAMACALVAFVARRKVQE